jgi:glycosyltransferase involved in cell wall biosynthesis
MKVLVVDMQPIDPPIGGGRIRLLGLYHNLGEKIETTYIGTYDWPGEEYRDHMLSSTLREINVPLSNAHFQKNENIRNRSGGLNTIDVLFSRHGDLSKDYVNSVKELIPQQDIVVFSHPWVYPLVFDCLDFDRQYVVYDSQNVEIYLRYSLLDDNGGFGSDAVREVAAAERKICSEAHEIIVCADDDGTLYASLFNVPLSKMTVVPNGVFSKIITPPNSEEQRLAAKKKLSFNSFVVLFMGSNYGPNIEGAHYIIDHLSGMSEDVNFVIAGGVGHDQSLIQKAKSCRNVIITGFIEERTKLTYLHAADFAINPMFRGSGTNIKMFDFMAAGLPVVSTVIGARGIVSETSNGVIVAAGDEFPRQVADLLKQDYDSLMTQGLEGRKLIEEKFSWETITCQLGALFAKSTKHHKHIKNSVKNAKPAVAIMTTWNIKCGISEYSCYLSESFIKKGYRVLIVGNDSIKELEKELDDNLLFYGGWEYHTTSLGGIGIDLQGIIQCVEKLKIKRFIIQHHDGFFSIEALMELCKKMHNINVAITIMLHNKSKISKNNLKYLAAYGVKIVSHHEISSVYSKFIPCKEIPHGILDGSKFGYNERHGDDYVIGSFGFLRPHKGILELIRALPLIHIKYPAVKLLCLNALYDDNESIEYYEKCLEEVDNLKLNGFVNFITEFLPVREVMTFLSTIDLIVLPYRDVDDGSSASANMAIACQRPIIISRSPIFNSYKGIFPELKSTEPHIIAETVISVLNKKTLSELSKKSYEYANEYSWDNIANIYLLI